jgi:uncharacterized protein YceK
MKLLRHLILLSTIISCLGCGTLLRSSDHVCFHSCDEYETAIKNYERTGMAPTNMSYVSSIGECYALHSVCLAQEVPWFEQTKVGLRKKNDRNRHGDSVGGAGAIFMPFTFLADTVSLPVQLIRTATLSDERLQQALRDLERARQLGYTNETWYPMEVLFTIRREHLDRLGFKAKPDNRESEQRPAPDR